MTKRERERLLRDADDLEECVALMNHGGDHWVQGTPRSFYNDGSIGYCSTAAIRKVKRSPEGRRRMAEAVIAWLVEKGRLIDSGDPFIGNLPPAPRLIAYNDSRERKWGEIRRAFLGAAAALRRKAKKA